MSSCLLSGVTSRETAPRTLRTVLMSVAASVMSSVRWLRGSLFLTVLLVLMVQAFQSVGTLWATKSDKRLRK